MQLFNNETFYISGDLIIHKNGVCRTCYFLSRKYECLDHFSILCRPTMNFELWNDL